MDYKDRNWLYKQYVIEEKNTRIIGKVCGVDHVTILYWLKKYDISIRQPQRPSRHPIHTGANGYLIISLGKKQKGGMLYHRYLMEQHLGRPLESNEVVHHKDGNKLNNDLSNLELLTHREHNNKHPAHPWPHKRGCRCSPCNKSRVSLETGLKQAFTLSDRGF